MATPRLPDGGRFKSRLGQLFFLSQRSSRQSTRRVVRKFQRMAFGELGGLGDPDAQQKLKAGNGERWDDPLDPRTVHVAGVVLRDVLKNKLNSWGMPFGR